MKLFHFITAPFYFENTKLFIINKHILYYIKTAHNFSTIAFFLLKINNTTCNSKNTTTS